MNIFMKKNLRDVFVVFGHQLVYQAVLQNFQRAVLKSLLEDKPIELFDEIQKLKMTSGAKFFDKNQQDVFPEKDFYLSTEINKFNFVLKLEKDKETGLEYIKKIELQVLKMNNEEKSFPKVSINCLTTVFPILLKNTVK